MQLWWSPYLWICFYLDVPTLKQEVEPFPPAQLWNGFEFSTISWYSTSRGQTIYFQTINQRDVGEVILNTSVSFFLHSSYLGWKLSEQEEAGSISISVFSFFCLFFLASSPVTCLTFHPINSRTTSRTAGAKVVPLEPQTDKPAGSWLRVRAGVTALLQPLCTRPRCRGNSMSAERVSSELWGQTQLWGFKRTLHHEVCSLWMDYNSV